MGYFSAGYLFVPQNRIVVSYMKQYCQNPGSQRAKEQWHKVKGARVNYIRIENKI